MNCKAEHYRLFIIFKAQEWLEIETRGINKDDRAWARRNRLQLIRRHSEIFAAEKPTGKSV